jgi:hypothetical protein
MAEGVVVAMAVKRQVAAVAMGDVEVVARVGAAIVASNGPCHITEEREEGNTSHVFR